MLNQRQQLDGQLNENMMVKSELDLLKNENDVFKLIGPVLVKQDLSEAKQNVSKRMDYIKAELYVCTIEIQVSEVIDFRFIDMNNFQETRGRYVS